MVSVSVVWIMVLSPVVSSVIFTMYLLTMPWVCLIGGGSQDMSSVLGSTGVAFSDPGGAVGAVERLKVHTHCRIKGTILH